MFLTFLINVLKCIGWILLSPFRFILMVRRATTEASVSLLLIVIVSLNIVWGYPWTGMFAASLTMLVLGLIASTVFRPRAEMDVSLPVHAMVGQPFAADIHVQHQGRLPAFDVTVGRLESRFAEKTPVEICSAGVPIASMSPNEWTQCRLMMVCWDRGVHDLPSVQLRSTFPFCLFQSEQRASLDSQIAVAPRPLTVDDDFNGEQFIAQVDRWAQAWFGGDSFDYAGSREYVVGMPVRRWDFRSWARLGRPIVREFQSPSRQVANLIVDTGQTGKIDSDQAIHLFERMLRYAATVVEVCNRDGIAATLYISSDSVKNLVDRLEQDQSQGGLSMLPLAYADVTDRNLADQRIQETLDDVLTGPTLLLTTRDLATESGINLNSQSTVIRIGPSNGDEEDGGNGDAIAWSSANDVTDGFQQGLGSREATTETVQ